MYKFGLKLWSVNDYYIDTALKLYKNGIFNYIELFVIPGSFNEYNSLWTKLDIPFIIHAPHFRNNFNLAKKENYEQNLIMIKETIEFADVLSAEYIICHPGIDGYIEETVKQLNTINEPRIIIENKPYYTVSKDGKICNGNSPEQIEFILKETEIGFCLDVGHCFCSANAQGIDPISYLEDFIKLNPCLYHLTDNDFSSDIDRHLHIGQGNMDFNKIFDILPKDIKITVETNKDSKENLDDFVEDINKLKKLTGLKQ